MRWIPFLTVMGAIVLYYVAKNSRRAEPPLALSSTDLATPPTPQGPLPLPGIQTIVRGYAANGSAIVELYRNGVLVGES